jgi:hypothetical protein
MSAPSCPPGVRSDHLLALPGIAPFPVDTCILQPTIVTVCSAIGAVAAVVMLGIAIGEMSYYSCDPRNKLQTLYFLFQGLVSLGYLGLVAAIFFSADTLFIPWALVNTVLVGWTAAWLASVFAILAKTMKDSRTEETIFSMFGGRTVLSVLLFVYAGGSMLIVVGAWGAVFSMASDSDRVKFWRVHCVGNSVVVVLSNLFAFTITDRLLWALNKTQATREIMLRTRDVRRRLQQARLAAVIVGVFGAALFLCFASFVPFFWFFIFIVCFIGALGAGQRAANGVS